MRRGAAVGALVCFLVGLVGPSGSRGEGAEAPLLDRSLDRICLRAEIAARGMSHGEVRIVARGGARVVQTLLYTRLLTRAVGEIRARELEGWPEGQPGHEASRRYVAALERAERAIPRPRTQGAPPGDRRRALLIEFVLSARDQVVALSDPRVEEAADGLVLADPRLVERLELPRGFVQRDMLRIAAEHFPGLGRGALDPREEDDGSC